MNSLVLASLSLPNLVSRLPGGVAQGIIWGIMALGVHHVPPARLRRSDGRRVVHHRRRRDGRAHRRGLAGMGGAAGRRSCGSACGSCDRPAAHEAGIPAILAGILTQFALYSVNLRIMSMKANTPVNPDKYDLFLTLRSVARRDLEGAAARGGAHRAAVLVLRHRAGAAPSAPPAQTPL